MLFIMVGPGFSKEFEVFTFCNFVNFELQIQFRLKASLISLKLINPSTVVKNEHLKVFYKEGKLGKLLLFFVTKKKLMVLNFSTST